MGEQHRQAVGHHDGARQAGSGGDAGIGHGPIGRPDIQRDHTGSMHLLQEHRMGAERLRQVLTVARHGFRIVAHVVTQVEAVEGRHRHATRPQGEGGVHPVRECPRRYQLMFPWKSGCGHPALSGQAEG